MADQDPTRAQINYLLILFNDCGFSDSRMRTFLKSRFSVSELDRLTRFQCSNLIGELKSKKAAIQSGERLSRSL